MLSFQGMAQPDRPYGSTFHLFNYRQNSPAILDAAIMESLKIGEGSIEWVYPIAGETRPEFTGLSFLQLDPQQRAAWEEFWPQSGTAPSWDAVARVSSAGIWLLIEAKANHPELCSSPCGAKARASLDVIERSLAETKASLGVHRFYRWEGTYYQYANRLALLHFLQKIGVATHLVFLYFSGDRFPDETPCPDSPASWKELIHACHLTLGLPDQHRLSPWIHDVFLPVSAPEGDV